MRLLPACLPACYLFGASNIDVDRNLASSTVEYVLISLSDFFISDSLFFLWAVEQQLAAQKLELSLENRYQGQVAVAAAARISKYIVYLRSWSLTSLILLYLKYFMSIPKANYK